MSVSRFDIGLWMFAGALVLIGLRMPVGVAMLLVGGVGYAAINGLDPLLNTLKTLTFSQFANYTLTVIPLFLLMGEFATKAGMSAALFRAGRAWFGHWRGGLAVATIGGCAAFGAICGSSFATAATMTRVAGPEMRKAGYSPALWTGTLAAGGMVGIYRGWFSPTEGAGVGAFATLLMAIWRGRMRLAGLREALLSTGETTAMMFLIMLGAQLFSAGLASSQMPTLFAHKVAALDASPTVIMIAIIIAYFILGCFMESLAMVLLTLPVFIPLILALDYGMSTDAVL